MYFGIHRGPGTHSLWIQRDSCTLTLIEHLEEAGGVHMHQVEERACRFECVEASVSSIPNLELSLF